MDWLQIGWIGLGAMITGGVGLLVAFGVLLKNGFEVTPPTGRIS